MSRTTLRLPWPCSLHLLLHHLCTVLAAPSLRTLLLASSSWRAPSLRKTCRGPITASLCTPAPAQPLLRQATTSSHPRRLPPPTRGP